ncbi:hypothetical protein ACJJI3_03205 [Microbulbifer sp. ZKSA004]|uniref:hypothetical protein n=1 Tax=Microbulbifer sp. ZKSA004 TaxID=3243389 RepID=UPI00403A7350
MPPELPIGSATKKQAVTSAPGDNDRGQARHSQNRVADRRREAQAELGKQLNNAGQPQGGNKEIEPKNPTSVTAVDKREEVSSLAKNKEKESGLPENPPSTEKSLKNWHNFTKDEKSEKVEELAKEYKAKFEKPPTKFAFELVREPEPEPEPEFELESDYDSDCSSEAEVNLFNENGEAGEDAFTYLR